MDATRTFVAIALPDAVGAKLARLQSQLAPGLPGVRWSEATAFHLTLAFLGDVEHPQLNNVCQAVARASSPFASFELRVEGLGVFPNPVNPRTFWIGLTGDDLSRLMELQAAVGKEVEALGFSTGEAVFRPHVTLGRSRKGDKSPRRVGASLDRYRTWNAGSFRVSEVITYSSELTREGPIYAPLARARLSGGKPRTGT